VRDIGVYALTSVGRCWVGGNVDSQHDRITDSLVRVGEAGQRALWTIWTRTSFGRMTNDLIDRLPARPKRWLEELKRDVRNWQPALRLRLREGRNPPLVSAGALERMFRNELRLLASEAGPAGVGDYLEFGVYVGTSLLCMHRASKAAGLGRMRLFGFDSFQGLPEAAAEDEGPYRPGWFRADYDLARENLSRNGIDWSRTVLVPGWFEDTLTPELVERLGIRKAGVILIDCDIYSAARTALEFCAPLIKDKAVVVLDDWPGDTPEAQGLGERRAFDEFLACNPDLRAEEREPYRWEGRPNAVGKVFLVTRAGAEVATSDRDDIATIGREHLPAGSDVRRRRS
jgi:predicted O-methyltransferase YrrM